MYKLITNIVLILATVAGVAGAANESAPGDYLYTLDRQIEEIQYLIFQNSDSLQALDNRIAEERMSEASLLIDRGKSVDALALLEENIESTPIVTLANNNLPVTQVSSEQPRVIATESCVNSARGQYPALAQLANVYQVSYSTMLNWYCEGFQTGEIAQAYAIYSASNVPVDSLFTQAQEGYGWDEIALAAGLTDDSGLENETNANAAFCSADGLPLLDKQHPEGLKVADALGTSYEMVMGWFCKGYAFGEIKLAYSLSVDSEQPIEAIFALYDTGMSWGAIMQQVTQPEKPNNKPVEPSSEQPTDVIQPIEVQPTQKPEKTERPTKP